ncbi:MAG: ZIP family metal transporter [Candidatus Woesearchaeota archaeon]
MIWLYSIFSVVLISLISLIGLLTFTIKESNLKEILTYFVSFSVGGLLGDSLLHLLPESIELNSSLDMSLLILLGIISSFAIEKFVQWRHCHIPTSTNHPHPFAIMNLIGDAVHNFIDGLIIGASYLSSLNLGVATTLAVAFHEIPQEIGDFGVLIHGGFRRNKAILLNFVTALASVAGVVICLLIGSYIASIKNFILPFAIGSFIYIASSDLIPELHKVTKPSRSIMQMIFLIIGVGLMYLLLFLE